MARAWRSAWRKARRVGSVAAPCSRSKSDAADQPHPLAEEGVAGERQQGAAGVVEAGREGAGILRLAAGELGAPGEVIGDGGERAPDASALRTSASRLGRDVAAVVEGAAQGDHGEAAARSLGVSPFPPGGSPAAAWRASESAAASASRRSS